MEIVLKITFTVVKHFFRFLYKFHACIVLFSRVTLLCIKIGKLQKSCVICPPAPGIWCGDSDYTWVSGWYPAATELTILKGIHITLVFRRF